MIKKQFKENINIQIRPNLTYEFLKQIVQKKNQDIKIDTKGIRSLRDSHEINSGLLGPSAKTQISGDNNKFNGKQATLKRKNQLSKINQQAKKHKKFHTKIKQNVSKIPNIKKEEYLQKLQEDKQQCLIEEIIQKNIQILRTNQIQCQLISCFKVIQKTQKLQLNKQIQPKHEIIHNKLNKKIVQKDMKEKPTQLYHNIKDTKDTKKQQHIKNINKKQMFEKNQNEDKKRLQKIHQSHHLQRNKGVKLPEQMINSPCQKILQDIFQKVFQNISQSNHQNDKTFPKNKIFHHEQVENQNIKAFQGKATKQQNGLSNLTTQIDKKQQKFHRIQQKLNQKQTHQQRKTQHLQTNKTNHQQNKKKGDKKEYLQKNLLSNNILKQSTNKKTKKDIQNMRLKNEKDNNMQQYPQNKTKKLQIKNQVIYKHHRQRADQLNELKIKKN